MRTPHPDTRPTRPRALPPGWLGAVACALALLLLTNWLPGSASKPTI